MATIRLQHVARVLAEGQGGQGETSIRRDAVQRPLSVQRGRESRSSLRSPWPCLSAGCIEGDRGTDERLERARVDLLPLMDVNRAPCVPVEARVEKLGRVLQRTPLGE